MPRATFARGVEGGFDAVTSDSVGDFEEFILRVEERDFALHLTGELGEFFLSGDELDDFGLGEVESFDEISFGHFVGSTFDHDDLSFVAHINEIEIAIQALALGRIDNELTVDAADADSADGACERDVRHAKSGGSTVHGADVRIVLTVSAEEDGHDLGVVVVALREQRTQWAVRHAAGEDFLFGRGDLRA